MFGVQENPYGLRWGGELSYSFVSFDVSLWQKSSVTMARPISSGNCAKRMDIPEIIFGC
jgi:hypothetical protein